MSLEIFRARRRDQACAGIHSAGNPIGFRSIPSLNLIAVRNGGTLETPPKDPGGQAFDVFKLYHDAHSRILFEPLIDAMTDETPGEPRRGQT